MLFIGIASSESRHSLVLAQIARNKKAADDLKTSLDDLGKDRADRFDMMYDEEVNKIRLDETGWKARCVGCWHVCALTCVCKTVQCVLLGLIVCLHRCVHC
jgi:hypothetical protein